MVASDEERVKIAVRIMKNAGIAENIEVLGSGHESVVLSDGKKIYKIFDRPIEYYSHLMKQLIGRFDKCKHFISRLDYFKIGEQTVLIYDYEPSDPYTGGMCEEMQDFLLEAALCGVVVKDVNPQNFRVYDDGLKFIDYGWDIVPFNYKDFIFMAQRAYLSLNGWANPEFKILAKKGINTWDLPQLNGFKEFFNETYSKILKSGSMFRYDLLTVPENLWIEDILNCFFDTDVRIIFDERSDFKISESHDFSSRPVIGDKTAVVFDLTLNEVFIQKLKKQMKAGQKLAVIFKNPFFKETDNISFESAIRFFEKCGLKVIRTESSPPRPDENASFFSRLMFFETEAFDPCGYDTSLLIKACYQDGGTLETLVTHIVKQLERPDHFKEVLVVVDSKEYDFIREYSAPKKRETLQALDRLKERGIINDYFISPSDENEILRINREWFSVECSASHCIRNIPVAPQLFGFEKCSGDYILQVDCDAIVVRRDFNHSYLSDMINALKSQSVVSVSFNISHSPAASNVEYCSNIPSYVPEVRFCLFEKKHFFNMRPYPNEIIDGKLKYTWYRSVEIAQNERGFCSLRGGDPRTFYIHPPNNIKNDKEFWFRVLERVESGIIPDKQFEKVDLCGNSDDWLIPKRSGNFIFVISGRNISNEKFLRGWQSVVSQTRNDWEAIIINDNSDNHLHEYIKEAIAPYLDRTTYIQNPFTKVILENIHQAVKNICINPYSVIIIMDMDDMLLTNDVLTELRKEYLTGADMTAGTALKTSSGILPFVPDFKNPRNERMGDVWIHLRSFPKYMFDSIDDEYFKHKGEWIDKFNELTYTVPMAEMAEDPRFIDWPLYLWEPGHVRNEEHYRLNEISKDVVRSKSTYIGFRPFRSLNDRILPSGEVLRSATAGNVTFIRHAEKEEINYRTTERGQREARLWGKSLPFKIDLFLTSLIERTAETAWCIKEGNESTGELIPLRSLEGVHVKKRNSWEESKSEVGFWNTIEKWIQGEIPEEIIESYETSMLFVLESIWKTISEKNSENTLVITHDHIILYLHMLFYQTKSHKVPHLGGFSLPSEEIYKKIIELKTKICNHRVFRTSLDTIEIDITYRCDLGCNNCDRSCGRAQADDDMSVEQIQTFLNQSIQSGISWKRIRIMGGEPMLHPEIETILGFFNSYGESFSNTEIELYTNGLPKKHMIQVPDRIQVHLTEKNSRENPEFEPYNLAPIDFSGIKKDFSQGCWITSYCGLGLNKYGYYPCAAGAAVDRVFGFDVGHKELPFSEEQLSEVKSILCAYCGHYLCDGSYRDPEARTSIRNLEPMTESWAIAYDKFNENKPELTKGGRL